MKDHPMPYLMRLPLPPLLDIGLRAFVFRAPLCERLPPAHYPLATPWAALRTEATPAETERYHGTRDVLQSSSAGSSCCASFAFFFFLEAGGDAGGGRRAFVLSFALTLAPFSVPSLAAS